MFDEDRARQRAEDERVREDHLAPLNAGKTVTFMSGDKLWIRVGQTPDTRRRVEGSPDGLHWYELALLAPVPFAREDIAYWFSVMRRVTPLRSNAK